MARMHYLVAVVIAGAGVLAGCGAPRPEAATRGGFTAPVVRTLPRGVVPASTLPTAVANVDELRTRVSMSRCEQTAHGWLAGGTAHNPGTRAATYTVTIFFTTASATVINWASAKVGAGPGATVRWSLVKDFVAPPDTRCVLRGVGGGS